MAVLKRVLFFLTALAVANVAHATPVMARPANVSEPKHVFPLEEHPVIHHVQKRATGKVNMAYYVNWGVYTPRLFFPQNIDVSQLSHILYAFADVDASSGTIALSDLYADTQLHFPTDSWNDVGNNLYGALKQLYLLKLANRNLKVLLSVGGWTYSQNGHFNFVTSASARATFVASAVSMVESYGFDGIDLDFEYPSTAAQGQGFADLFTALRTAFDALAAKKGDTTPYQISAAVSAGPANYANLVVPQMNSALTFWNLMAYDYAGSWITFADNQANLYGGARTGFSTDAAVKHFLSAGATASKIIMGIPLYGHAFEQTAGLGQPYSGIGPGTYEAGIYSYNALPIAGAQVFENTTDVSSYSYDATKKELVSYDTPDIARIKAQYVTANSLGGTMFWELSTDKTGSDSLVGTTKAVFGGLDSTPNHISYPSSTWDNIRSNMGQSSGGTTTTTSSGGGATGTPGVCSGVPAWTSTAIFTGGQSAVYNSHLWTASWWTQGDTPGGSAGVWVDHGAC
ncbi:glycosyl hydrolases family 18-domain-containing protein [Mycena amicta]|nr:glycosyl hydrolases family 18-domain-containing protein [Mycena amicta]